MTTLIRSSSTQPERPRRTWAVWSARLLWLLVALVIAALYAEMVPRNLVQTRYEWAVQQAMEAMPLHVSFTSYVKLVIAVEYLVVAFYVGAALLILWKRNDDPFALFVSATLLLLSTTFGISSNMDALHLPASLARSAPWLETVLPVAILVSFALLFYLLPDGRFAPPWLVWTGGPSLFALAVAAVVMFGDPYVSGITGTIAWLRGDAIWYVLLPVMLLPLVGGPAVQLARIRKETDALVRRQRLWLCSIMAVPLLTLGLLLLAWLNDGDDELGWALFVWTIFTPMVFGLASQIYRYLAETDPIRRQQIKWLAWGLSSPFLGFLLGLLMQATVSTEALYFAIDNVFYPLLTTLIPLSILFSMLRYRLWGIDALLNRTLVYGVLTVLIATLYMLLVGVLSATLRDGAGLALSVAATGLIALLFQPLRQGLQRLANRLIYGERDDPATVLARLGRRLEGTVAPDTVLPTIVETVAQALKLPYAAIALGQSDDDLVVAVHGQPGDREESFPLTYQGETLGRLTVAPRTGGESLTAGDRRLLADIAHQAGPAVHAVQLTAELQRSRVQLVTAREEERRRLRRDLHDGLGPQLAGLSMKIDAARNRLQSDPDAADELLRQFKRESQDALADLRRLVYGLRPPALDQLGLVSALRDYVMARREIGTLFVQIEAPDDLPPLPAAVEVAAYRIALEALTNVAHHAGATTCRIELQADESLHMAITDDGAGIDPDAVWGVGLTSMCERAEELGGLCEIASLSTGGVRIVVRLPLHAADAQSLERA